MVDKGDEFTGRDSDGDGLLGAFRWRRSPRHPVSLHVQWTVSQCSFLLFKARNCLVIVSVHGSAKVMNRQGSGQLYVGEGRGWSGEILPQHHCVLCSSPDVSWFSFCTLTPLILR